MIAVPARSRPIHQRRRALRASADQRRQDNHLVRRERVMGECVEALNRRALRRARAPWPRASGCLAHEDKIIRVALSYGPDRRHGLDVCCSPDAAHAPLLVFFYGGAWRAGSKDDFEFIRRALARLGVVVIIGDQRLAPQVRFPAFLEDSARLIAWTQRNAVRFGGSAGRTLLLGHSAGAYNAMMLTFARRDAPPLLVATGMRDAHVPHENSISLVEAMKAPGGQCAFRRYPAASHLDPLLGLVGLDRARAPTRRDVMAFAQALGLVAPTLDAEALNGLDRLALISAVSP